MKKKKPSTNEKKSNLKQSPRYFYVITIFIPAIFFLLMEFGLRLFGYGIRTEQWIPATENKLMLNPDIARRYFHTIRNIPISNQDIFDIEKKPNAFRVFILGESSGAGYPYTPIGSFSRWLQKRLEILYPDCTIEIVNVSMTAINSYTLRDLFPGVVEQKPDLVLIYAGHNEYYGALGVGSTETFGANRTLVMLTLYLNKFKTIELLRNTISAVSKFLSLETATLQDGTLMSRIAKDQYIEFDSEEFQKGLSQYEENMRDILETAKSHRLPLILGTLTNNLKDQKPFISADKGKYPPAKNIFETAKKELEAKNFHTADSLFRLAKDLDVLRFRSAEKMNQLIIQLGKDFGCPVVQIDSVFNAISPHGIVGDNLMTDHLHPTLSGYELMAKLYFETMRKEYLLPHCNALQLTDNALDSTTHARFKFSRLDSVIAIYRILILKNDWPYIEKKDQKKLSELITPNDFLGKTALEFLDNNVPWESVHRKAAGWYLVKKDYTGFREQMDVLISQYPVVVEYYDFAANELLKVEKYDEAYSYLVLRHTIKPNSYSTKWLGNINLSKNKTADAIKYLEESLTFDSSDPQVFYNLSGAYSYKKEFHKALDAINKCLTLDPSFPKAANLRNQLQQGINQK
jgi:tetratricopeptide (TPR) repeat protein